jgi:hypothetical protein
MEKHYDITKIDWNELRNQKLELLKAITERNLTDDPLEVSLALSTAYRTSLLTTLATIQMKFTYWKNQTLIFPLTHCPSLS